MAEEDNYPSDISTDERSFVPRTSLEGETGRGNDTVLYPPNNFAEIQVSPQNQVSRQVTNAPAAQQTSKVRTSSDSSESDTPDEVNTPTSRSQEELVTSQTSYNTTDISRQLQNKPLQIKHSRLQIRGETASMENVLSVPDCPGYADMRGPFIKRAKHPKFKSEEYRLRSFRYWPLQQPSPRQLTAAGLFYIGCNGTEDHDLVCCYRCGGTLREFEPGDNPEEEHRKWYPRCLETDWDC